MNRKILAGLGAGLSIGGALAQSADADRIGTDDKLGQAMTIAGAALTQASANSTGTKNERAADAIEAVAAALTAFAGELRAGG